ncbi:hypothetical protein [Pelagicoccus enzymogenes]|uniref:hypothetical protein n=1 Tax=Pelagicoccus enzymogenes TaxID=2773457 RepID=UPI002811AF9C|nr:hypothetical protein [Pelagicoccus enzymogenes]
MTESMNHQKACVGIAAIVSGVSVGIVALFAIFAPVSLPAAGWIVAPLSLMGIGLGFLSTKPSNR